MQNEAGALLQSAVQLCFHMKGGLTYTEAIDLCPMEREVFARFLDSHYEAERKMLQNARGGKR